MELLKVFVIGVCCLLLVCSGIWSFIVWVVWNCLIVCCCLMCFCVWCVKCVCSMLYFLCCMKVGCILINLRCGCFVLNDNCEF